MNIAAVKQWLSAVKGQLEKNPLASNIGFALILLCFEKIVELEFVCPCQSKLNAVSALSFFSAPALIVFLLMLSTEHPCKSCKSFVETVLHGLVPAVTWCIILFMDGRYYACFWTNWSGHYETSETASPLKWCKPANLSHGEEIQTLEWYATSQVIGLWVAVILTAVFKLYLFCKSFCCKHQEGTDDANNAQDIHLQVQNSG
ncbi:protein FAM26D-like [Poecilia latipinna]|uniref:protein FAM26D-like n=1 Tax=Poecilia latipinna TaxID=48699 RepID=UPI00072DCEBA|nr:PREDICTED: protein FAM26D-like [Poecilia latipinna]